MTSDESRAPPDTKWRPTGVGMHQLFRCARCNKPKSKSGSKVQRVMGIPQYVCKECVK